jgi:predicted nucleic acid-binding protein
MVLEATSRFNLPPREALRYLKAHPERAKTLLAHHDSVRTILQIGVEVVVVGLEDIARSHDVKQRYGLLTNDALTVAVMERYGVTALASNDPDFESVPTLALYRPTPS